MYPGNTMSLTKPAPRARPAVPATPSSPRAEENQGYRRGRAIRSCLECRRRKMRCNRSRPCQNCNRFCRDCVYLAFPDWPSGAPNNANGEGSAQSPAQGGGRAFPSYESNQHTGLVQTSPSTHHHLGCDSDALAKHNGLYDMDADGEPLDVAIQVGRLSITEKIGGFFRPHVASQVSNFSFPSRAQPSSVVPATPGEHPQLRANIILCSLMLFCLTQIIPRAHTSPRLPMAHP